MKESDNSKIHISSNFLLSVCLLIMLDTFITRTITTLQHFATLHHTSPNYTSLHLSTLHFLSFTLHYRLIWLNSFRFPTVLFHLTSLNWAQYSTTPDTVQHYTGHSTALHRTQFSTTPDTVQHYTGHSTVLPSPIQTNSQSKKFILNSGHILPILHTSYFYAVQKHCFQYTMCLA
jgi:hypothetical protein